MRIKLAKPTAAQKSVIFAVLSGLGVVVTSYVTARCAKKTTDEMTAVQKAKAYAPAIVSGGVTIGCIAAGTYISQEEIALVTAAGAAIAQKYADYRKSVKEVVSEEQLEQIDISFYEKEIARLEEELAKREHPTDEDDLVTFVDAFSGYTFKARMEQVEAGLIEVNKHWEEDECLYWCDIFYLLNNKDDIPWSSSLGEGSLCHYGYGWSKRMFEEFEMDTDNLFAIEMHPMKDHPDYYLIDYPIDPEIGFMDY